jgi:Protein of unknown function (DUF2865)
MRQARQFVLLALMLLIAVSAGTSAWASCAAIQAELASLPQSGSRGNQREAAAAAAEANQIAAQMDAMGCNRRGLFNQPPPQCPAYYAHYQRLAAIAQSYRGDGGDTEARRRQLKSLLISYNCSSSRDRETPRQQAIDPVGTRRSIPLTAGTFDDGQRRRGELSTDPTDVDIDPREEVLPPPRRIAGGKPVCVRTCDGYYFPLHMNEASLRQAGDTACQSLCPGAETKLYRMSSRGIEGAVSVDGGQRYTALPTAFRYRKTYDAACFCRQPGERWMDTRTSVLNGEPTDQRDGFGVLNPVPEPVPAPDSLGLRHGRKGQPQPEAALPPPPPPPHNPGEPVGDRVVTIQEGETREQSLKDGTKRTVRVIAPELSPAPSTAATPSIPGRAPAR